MVLIGYSVLKVGPQIKLGQSLVLIGCTLCKYTHTHTHTHVCMVDHLPIRAHSLTVLQTVVQSVLGGVVGGAARWEGQRGGRGSMVSGAVRPTLPSYCEGPQKLGLKIFANMSLSGRRDASETLENRSEANIEVKLSFGRP